ncbi:MAG: hypothetical protein FJ403_23415 [Verrucomicrobia bacterium]|nr:hypothetical protein [Verrucomicrobiota bacterium]
MNELKNAMIVILDRLTAAGWVDKSAVTSEGVKVLWTEIGEKSIGALKPLLAVLQLPLSEDEQKCLLFLVTRTETAGK